MWSYISNKTIEKKKIRRKRKILLQLTSYAALVIFAIGSIFYLVRENDQKEAFDYGAAFTMIDSTSSNKIRLVLEDGSPTEIDENNAEIVYNDKGEVIINSQTMPVKKQEKKNSPRLNKIVVPYGKTASLILNDGTKIWVNSGSKLIYPSSFQSDKREISVEGEVYLDVIKDETRPFIVNTENLLIKVLGTSFNLSAYKNDDEQSVVLMNGSVEIVHNKSESAYKISPSQKYTLDREINSINIETIDLKEYDACWRYNMLCCYSEKLTNVLERLKRHYNISFSYNTSQLENIEVSGKLDLSESIFDVLENVALTTPISYATDNENNIIITLIHK